MGGRSAPTRRTRPVARARIIGATLVVVLGLVGLGALTETLRHPLPDGGPAVPELDEAAGDPRIPVECGEPLPREGQERDEDTVPTAPPVEVTSNELYDCPETYARSRVRYRGEVVGAVLRRDEGAWVHLNDDIYGDEAGPLPAHRDYRGGNAGVGVFIPLEVADAITFVGGPRAEGDVLAIEGVFRRVDPVSGEAAVIVASAAEVVAEGQPFVDPVLLDRRIVAGLVALLTLGLFVTDRTVARRERDAGVVRSR